MGGFKILQLTSQNVKTVEGRDEAVIIGVHEAVCNAILFRLFCTFHTIQVKTQVYCGIFNNLNNYLKCTW